MKILLTGGAGFIGSNILEKLIQDNDIKKIFVIDNLSNSTLKISDDFIKSSKLLTKDIDSVISYTEMEFPPTLGLILNDDNNLVDYDKLKPWYNGNTRSQDHPTVYRPNGAIYGSWTSKLKENKNYYVGQIKGYFMLRNRSVDIDTQFEFDMVEYMLKNKKY